MSIRLPLSFPAVGLSGSACFLRECAGSYISRLKGCWQGQVAAAARSRPPRHYKPGALSNPILPSLVGQRCQPRLSILLPSTSTSAGLPAGPCKTKPKRARRHPLAPFQYLPRYPLVFYVARGKTKPVKATACPQFPSLCPRLGLVCALRGVC